MERGASTATRGLVSRTVEHWENVYKPCPPWVHTRPAVERIRPVRDRCDALRYALGHGLECPALREAAGEAAAAACGAGHGWGRATGKVEA